MFNARVACSCPGLHADKGRVSPQSVPLCQLDHPSCANASRKLPPNHQAVVVAQEKSSVRKDELDAMVRDLRAREEAASREKLRAFKAQRPRVPPQIEHGASCRMSCSLTTLQQLIGTEQNC